MGKLAILFSFCIFLAPSVQAESMDFEIWKQYMKKRLPEGLCVEGTVLRCGYELDKAQCKKLVVSSFGKCLEQLEHSSKRVNLKEEGRQLGHAYFNCFYAEKITGAKSPPPKRKNGCTKPRVSQ